MNHKRDVVNHQAQESWNKNMENWIDCNKDVIRKLQHLFAAILLSLWNIAFKYERS